MTFSSDSPQLKNYANMVKHDGSIKQEAILYVSVKYIGN